MTFNSGVLNPFCNILALTKHHWAAANGGEFVGHQVANNFWLTGERVVYLQRVGMGVCVGGVVEGLVVNRRMWVPKIRP